jgi:cell wall-associated NlpC family hydrolase
MSARAVSNPRRVLAAAAIACSLPLSAVAVHPTRANAAGLGVLPAEAMTAVASQSVLADYPSPARAATFKVSGQLVLDRARMTAGGTVVATVRARVGELPAAASQVVVSVRSRSAAGWTTVGTAVTGRDGVARVSFRATATVLVRAEVVTAAGPVAMAGAPSLTVVPKPAPKPAARPAVRTAATARVSGGVLALAASFRGTPYRYGASGPSAFDCSGFTAYVFRHATGRFLPHNAAAQYAVSRKVSRSAVRPGDLIFFRNGGGIYHVGIYAGNGMMWDAPHSGSTVGLHPVFSSNWVAGRV